MTAGGLFSRRPPGRFAGRSCHFSRHLSVLGIRRLVNRDALPVLDMHLPLVSRSVTVKLSDLIDRKYLR